MINLNYIYYTLISINFMIFIICANMEKVSLIISSISGNIMLFLYTFFITNDIYFTLFFQSFVIIIGVLLVV